MTMIVETRFRDIPFEEALKCVSTAFMGEEECNAKSWNSHRGKPVRIITPAAGDEFDRKWFDCKGPFYYVAAKDGSPSHAVCPHLAEIGD